MEDDLKRLLDELSAAIERTREGHEDRAEFARLSAAVEQRLQAGEPAEEHPQLVEALKTAEARFEAGHPVLGDAIRHAIQALTAAGI